MLEFIRQGLLDKQIQDNISFYQATRDYMLEQMGHYFPAAVFRNRSQGGFFIFVYLPPYMDAAELFRRAVERKVAFVTGQPFFVDGRGHNTFRLSYAQAGNEDIQVAIRVLGKLIKDSLPRRKIKQAA